MGTLTNLNKYRKHKAKAERVQQAETNRRWHGRTKAERALEALKKKQLASAVEQARLVPATDDDAPPSTS